MFALLNADIGDAGVKSYAELSNIHATVALSDFEHLSCIVGIIFQEYMKSMKGNRGYKACTLA